MKPPVAAQAPEVGSRPGTAAGRQFSPVAFALDRLFPKHGRAPYSAAERLVVLVIVRATSADESSGDFNCFLSYPTIAKWAGVSIASVKRALQKHCDGPAPLLYRSMAGETRGHAHACYRFTLVMHPERFAAARDAARGGKAGTGGPSDARSPTGSHRVATPASRFWRNADGVGISRKARGSRKVDATESPSARSPKTAGSGSENGNTIANS